MIAAKKLGTEIRQEQIAEAALELVASQGVRRLSVAAVARRVGLVPSGTKISQAMPALAQ